MIIVFVLGDCQYCKDAVELLQGSRILFGVIDVTRDDERRRTLRDATRCSTLPSVWLGDQIGRAHV